MAGTQTVVIRQYGSGKKPGQEAAPIALHIPKKFSPHGTDQIAEVWGINLLLSYPGMDPLKRRSEKCRRAWCGDEIILTLQVSNTPLSETRAAMDRNNFDLLGPRSDPLMSISKLQAPSDYTDAYLRSYPKRVGSKAMVYLRRNGAGMIEEYTECSPEKPNPNCSSNLSFFPIPTLQIQYTFNMALWNERAEVAAAVQHLVGSFMPVSIGLHNR